MEPLINSHTHIFSYKDVPPFIARKFIPFPFYLLTHFSLVFLIFRFYRKSKRYYYKLRAERRKMLGLARSNYFTSLLLLGITLLIALNAIYFILDWVSLVPEKGFLGDVVRWLTGNNLILPSLPALVKVLVVAGALVVNNSLRTLIVKISKTVVKPLSYLPNEKTMEFINRYLKIAAIANYKSQATAYNKLYKMYPPGSKFVVLTMDMTYMNRTPPRDFYQQLDEIVDLMAKKDNDNYRNIIPFLFVDPRRVEKDPGFFKWTFSGGKIVLEECQVKKYLEDGPFRGVKIYPAIGYYAFDERLMPLWLYCVQEEIPITTHCTVGTIFYRRTMKREWFTHPVFINREGKPLNIYAASNVELQKNFTNPLNYLVLVEPYFLKRLLSTYKKETQDLFGYKSIDEDLDRDLSKLKINIAHYGGVEQWTKHQDLDRLEYAQEIMENPEDGIRLFASQRDAKKILDEKPADLWRKADWYAIISSLMLQYEGVYADISYIIHSPGIRPLLKLTLKNPDLSKKVLFGTDYYVVRNHKSEKELYAEMIQGFTDAEINQMARGNPNRFLRIKRDKNPLL